jgi:chromate transport protein ChrA
MSSAALTAASSRVQRAKFFPGLVDTIVHTWYLGFTSFGGPPTHFKILNDRFVTKLGWLTPQVYLEQFALAQSLPGPGSTKLLFCIAVLHAGLIAGLVCFLLWMLPGALAMYGLSLGVNRIDETLPDIVYALLSGLNGATVGIVALAAVELASKSITDKVTRICVFVGGAAGLLYTALWYFPVLMVAGGLATVAVDFGWVKWVTSKFQRKKAVEREQGVALEEMDVGGGRAGASGTDVNAKDETEEERKSREEEEARTAEQIDSPNIWGWKVGLAIVVFFFASFIGVMIARGVWDARPVSFAVFANFYLAGKLAPYPNRNIHTSTHSPIASFSLPILSIPSTHTNKS